MLQGKSKTPYCYNGWFGMQNVQQSDQVTFQPLLEHPHGYLKMTTKETELN